MKHLKQSLAALAIAAIFAGPAQAQIPVTDAASIAQDVMAHAENIAKWVSQLQEMKAQLDQAKQLYNSLNGARGMASLLNNPAAREYLPAEAQQIYSLATTGNAAFSSLSGSVKALKQAGAILKSTDMTNPRTAAMVDQAQNQIATMQATAEAAFKQAGDRFQQLQTLVESVDSASDPKAAADLQNRIAAEQSMLQNEMLKLSMLRQLQDAQERALAQQKRERAATKGGGTPVMVSAGG